jgi:phage tail sheath protein FI
MPETFLHGVELLEITDGPRPIRSVRSSVIGLVGTGDNDEVQAVATIPHIGTAQLNFTAKANIGAAGNLVSITTIKPSGNNAPLTVSVSGSDITVSLATDGSSVATSTLTSVRNAIMVNVEAAQLISSVSVNTGSSGTSLWAVHGKTFLAGGTDSSFPLDTPVLVTSPRDIDAKLGADTYLGKALESIYKQAGAAVVVVRAEDITGDATDLTGVYALKKAQATLGYTPRIVVCEDAEAIIEDVKSVCSSLRAVCFVGLPATNYTNATAATAWVTANANQRVMAIWPSINGGQDPAPLAAGLLAKSDNDRGFWWSPSNQEIFGITSLDAPVDFMLGDTTSLANILNEGNVTTFIRQGGFRLWGNRTGSIDPKWSFLSVRRTADIINDSIQRAHLWAVDRNITKTYFEDVTESVNAYLRTLENQGAILGGRCWPDPDLNSPDQIQLGKVYFNFEFTPPYPAEHITFRSELVNDYLVDLV